MMKKIILGFIYTFICPHVCFAASAQTQEGAWWQDKAFQLLVHEEVIDKNKRPKVKIVNYNKMIFDDPEMVKEFKTRYRESFGYATQDQNFYQNNYHNTVIYDIDGVKLGPEQDISRQQEYGAFVVKRLSEHHVDNYFKSSESLKPVYELKEKLQNVNVEVRKGYTLKLKYSLSGNYAQLKVTNPYDIKSYLTFEMNKSSFGPSSILETICHLGFNYSKNRYFEANYAFNTATLTFTNSQALTSKLSASVVAKVYFNDEQSEILEDKTKENILLLGFNYQY